MDRISAQYQYLRMAKQASGKVRTNFKQPKGRPNFIREWRKFRGYTQEQLAEMVGVNPTMISHLETRRHNYTQEMLEAIADALNCLPADLLMRNPQEPEAIWSLWDRANPGERAAIVSMVDGYLRRTGTDR
jgi:transcriptional regulator with XRE-family HTH domain